MMFTVTAFDDNNVQQIFTQPTLRKAKNWAAWLATQKWARDIRIYRGQAGEERVA